MPSTTNSDAFWTAAAAEIASFYQARAHQVVPTWCWRIKISPFVHHSILIIVVARRASQLLFLFRDASKRHVSLPLQPRDLLRILNPERQDRGWQIGVLYPKIWNIKKRQIRLSSIWLFLISFVHKEVKVWLTLRLEVWHWNTLEKQNTQNLQNEKERREVSPFIIECHFSEAKRSIIVFERELISVKVYWWSKKIRNWAKVWSEQLTKLTLQTRPIPSEMMTCCSYYDVLIDWLRDFNSRCMLEMRGKSQQCTSESIQV